MAVSELTTMGTGELEERLSESRQELFNLRFQLATGQLDNTARIGQVRRDAARVLTELRQRQIGEEAGETGGDVVVTAAAAAPAPARRRLGRRRAAGTETAETEAVAEAAEAAGVTGAAGETGSAAGTADEETEEA